MTKNHKRSVVSVRTKKYSYAKMSKDIRKLSEKYPEKFSYNVIGYSEDGREIYEITLGNPKADKCMLVVAAIHGREYMTSLLCMKQMEYYLIHSQKVFGNKSVADILDKIAIHYIPMANPDGVTISQFGINKIQDKTLRQRLHYMNHGNMKRWKANARGVDLNRNCPYEFRVFGVAGREGFSGKNAASEIETRVLLKRLDYLHQKKGLQSVVHYHAMGSVIFGNYQGNDEISEMTDKMFRLAERITGYRSAEGKTNETYTDSGNLREYVLYNCRIPSITMEIGHLPCPAPVLEFPFIWRRNRELMIKEAALFI